MRRQHRLKFFGRCFSGGFLQMNSGIVDEDANRRVRGLFRRSNQFAGAMKLSDVMRNEIAWGPMLWAASDSSFSRRPTNTTFAPAAARQRAMPKPKPVPPPVMSAVCPSSRKVFDFDSYSKMGESASRAASHRKQRRVLVLVHHEILAMAERFGFGSVLQPRRVSPSRAVAPRLLPAYIPRSSTRPALKSMSSIIR